LPLNIEVKILYFADNNKLVQYVTPQAAGTILRFIQAFGQTLCFIDEDEDTIVIELYAQQFNWTAIQGKQC
jgi:cytochrome c oxidase subunit 2